MRYLLWRGATVVFRALPLAASYRLADFSGTVTFATWRRGRENMLRNYRRVLPGVSESERRRVARRSMQNYCRYLVDFLRLPGMRPDEILARTHGEAAFRELESRLEAGRGAVIACMHFGNWDMGAAGTGVRGFSGAAIGERFGDRRIDEAVFGTRERLGVRIFPLDGPLVAAARHLRGNGILALLLDRPEVEGVVDVLFFGSRTRVPQGPARLALRTGAALGVAAFPRLARDRPDVGVMAEFIDLEVRGCDAASLTQWMVTEHERIIRRYPDQWYMFRDMWPEPG